MRRIRHWWWRRKMDRLWEKEVESEFEALELMKEADPLWYDHYMSYAPIPFCEFVKELRNVIHSDYHYARTVGAWLDTRGTLNIIRTLLLSCTFDTFDVCEMHPWSKWLKQDDFLKEVRRQIEEQKNHE